MNKEQCKKILASLLAYWDKEEMNDIKREFYYQALQEFAYDDVKKAVWEHIKHSGFFPKISDILTLLYNQDMEYLEKPIQIKPQIMKEIK